MRTLAGVLSVVAFVVLFAKGLGSNTIMSTAMAEGTVKCTHTVTTTETYDSVRRTKTVYKEVVAKPVAVDCGKDSACAFVAVKTVTSGSPIRTVYGSVTTAQRPYCK
jgi:hypothetical protein